METLCVSPRLRTILLADLTIGPSCKKMVDLTQDKIFKSAAFEPSQEDMYKVRRAQEKKKLGPPSSPIRAFSTARKIKTIDDIGNLSDSSSDDDLPDVKSLLDVVDQKPKFGKAARRIDDSDVRVFRHLQRYEVLTEWV